VAFSNVLASGSDNFVTSQNPVRKRSATCGWGNEGQEVGNLIHQRISIGKHEVTQMIRQMAE
jgi:hypothetical protein